MHRSSLSDHGQGHARTASRTAKATIAPMTSSPIPVPVVADTSILLLSALKVSEGPPRGLGSRGADSQRPRHIASFSAPCTGRGTPPCPLDPLGRPVPGYSGCIPGVRTCATPHAHASPRSRPRAVQPQPLRDHERLITPSTHPRASTRSTTDRTCAPIRACSCRSVRRWRRSN